MGAVSTEYRSFGRTGVQVSPLCLGCMMFGGKTSFEDSNAIIARALDAGINFLDTANVYHRGRSEEMVGRALKEIGRRDSIVLATKVNGAMADDDPNQRGISRRHIMAQCEASLRRLQTDYIDVYQLHRPDSRIPIDEPLRALDDLIRAGKVRYVGTSFFASWKLVESLWAAKELGLNRFVSEQPPYNVLDRRIERDLVPMAETYGFALIPFSPLAGGMLTGKYRDAAEVPADTRFADTGNWRNRLRMTDASVAAARRFAELAKAKGVSPSSYATAWAMHQPGITSPIIGPRTMEQMEDYLKAFDVEIGPDDAVAIDDIVVPGEHVSAFYQAEFGDLGPSRHSW